MFERIVDHRSTVTRLGLLVVLSTVLPATSSDLSSFYLFLSTLQQAITVVTDPSSNAPSCHVVA
jgi:hypothetical protein